MKNHMKAELVSVIMPVFNRASLVITTLQSILDQIYQNWECIIIDDGSTQDDYIKIYNFAKSDDRFMVLKRPNYKLKGANSCRNHGIEKSKGEFIIFFDSDDIMGESCLENRVNIFKKRLEYDFLVFSMGVINEKDCDIDKARKFVNLNNKETIEEFIFSKLPWQGSRPIFKNKLIKNKIWWNENIQNFQDDEFNIRVLANLNPKYLAIDITDSYYRTQKGKYHDSRGKQDVLNSYYEYSKTFFSILSASQVTANKDKLLLRFFSVLRHNVSIESNMESVYKTIDLINFNCKLSLKEVSIFNILIYLNKFYFNKKGSYKITQFLKRILIK